MWLPVFLEGLIW